MPFTLAMLLLQQDTTTTQLSGPAAAGLGMGFLVVWLAFVIFFVACAWKIFTKAGEPGWAAIVPIYNIIVLLKIVGKPAWWLILLLIPIVNFVVAIIVSIALAKSFGKGTGFGLGLTFLSPIFAPILAFGSSRYQGAAVA